MIDIGFWTTLSKKKLDEFKLDVSPKPIFGKYKINNFKDKGSSSHLFFDIYSFNTDIHKKQSLSGPVEINLIGDLIVLNTIEEFRIFPKEKTLEKLMEQQIKNVEDLELRPLFVLTVFADLKSHVFHYFFLYPSIRLEKIQNILLEPFKQRFPKAV